MNISKKVCVKIFNRMFHKYGIISFKVSGQSFLIFRLTDFCLAALAKRDVAITFRPSVRPSGCLSVCPSVSNLDIFYKLNIRWQHLVLLLSHHVSEARHSSHFIGQSSWRSKVMTFRHGVKGHGGQRSWGPIGQRSLS